MTVCTKLIENIFCTKFFKYKGYRRGICQFKRLCISHMTYFCYSDYGCGKWARVKPAQPSRVIGGVSGFLGKKIVSCQFVVCLFETELLLSFASYLFNLNYY